MAAPALCYLRAMSNKGSDDSPIDRRGSGGRCRAPHDTAKLACNEIEVTPEMIEAGLKELSFYSPREDSSEYAAEIVETIFRTMLACHHKK